MNFLSIKFKSLGVVVAIGLILGMLLAFYSPYEAKSLAKKTLQKDAEFITQLLVENLSLGIQAMILDDGASLQQSLEILQSDDNENNVAISKVRVFNEMLHEGVDLADQGNQFRN